MTELGVMAGRVHKRPKLVWVFSGWYLFMGLMGLGMATFAALGESPAATQTREVFYPNFIESILSLLGLVLIFAIAIDLFRLKRRAVWWLGISVMLYLIGVVRPQSEATNQSIMEIPQQLL